MGDVDNSESNTLPEHPSSAPRTEAEATAEFDDPDVKHVNEVLEIYRAEVQRITRVVRQSHAARGAMTTLHSMHLIQLISDTIGFLISSPH